ncbi:MAG: TerB family tellurite resistance protein [Nannocystis sp.]|nr:TerB family tellurite resistance protein [Nannocystis sp.]MBA3550535.1 TerB family tellurite resistance protein [Nannocystis sp.]
MKQHIETITQLLLGAAYADKRLEGAEVARIEAILRQVLGGEPPVELSATLRSFNPAAFNVHSTTTALQGLDAADKRKLLELIASVNDADEELDLAEDAYLRHVAIGMGVPESEIADLILDVLDDEELFGMLT